jgi:hypothetical protein
MPITKAVISVHQCDPPPAARLISLGYLATTEWTCDECGTVHVLSTEGMAAPYWEKIEPPGPEPEPEPEPDPGAGEGGVAE